MVAVGTSDGARTVVLADVGPGGVYPGGGFLSKAVAVIVIAKKTRPRIWNVGRHPRCAINDVATGPMIAEPAPYPPTMKPITRPRLSGNHFDPTGVGAEYPKPFPIPTRTPKVA